MISDVLYILLAVTVVIVFIVIVAIWLINDSKPFNSDATIKGFYDFAQLNQRCVAQGAQKEESFLPTFFQPQTCAKGLSCLLANTTDTYGFCKADIGTSCNTVYDCYPSTTNPIYCSGGICSATSNGSLFSSCTPGTTGGLQCDISLGLQCSNIGVCLFQDGFPCTGSNECIGGGCAIDGVTGVCVSQYTPAGSCAFDYCESGFGCTGAICEPLYSGVPAYPGTKGSFCSIPLYNPLDPYPLPCNDGLICNFDADLLAPSNYPGITGYGLCDVPNRPITFSCNSLGGACIPPSVCYDGLCQAPKVENIGDINYCGLGSSNSCGSDYECNEAYQCVPTTLRGICNGVTGICTFGTCSNNQMGMFTPYRSKNIGASGGNFGSWNFMNLPVDFVGGTGSTQLTSYQYMSLDVNNIPITYTRLALYPGNEVPHFYYSEIEVKSDNTINVIDDWTKITPTLPTGTETLVGVKFSTGGNYVVNSVDSGTVSFYLAPFTTSNFNVSSGDNFYTSIINTLCYDVDDVYNSSFVICSENVSLNNVGDFIFGTVPYSSPPIVQPVTFKSSTQLPNWVKFIPVPSLTGGSGVSPNNFLFNGTLQGEADPSINNLLSLPYTFLEQEVCSGVGANFAFTNNINEYEIYYVSDSSYRYYNLATESDGSLSVKDVAIQGYPPTFSVDDINQTLTRGKLDGRLFTILTLCV